MVKQPITCTGHGKLEVRFLSWLHTPMKPPNPDAYGKEMLWRILYGAIVVALYGLYKLTFG